MAEKRWEVVAGDCLETLKTLADCSVDSVVTDPPYGLRFMGKAWDHSVPSVDVWRECLRVLKPGGHLLAFAGTRTQHRMACAIEDAGFEIRDLIAWVYGSGFPKSLDVSKAIDKAAGAERERYTRAAFGGTFRDDNGTTYGTAISDTPATDAAKQWQGWGTALKPALEPITVARKPLCGTVADNVLEWRTGAINVDGCRVEHSSNADLAISMAKNPGRIDTVTSGVYGVARPQQSVNPSGRWPANIIHDGSDEVVGLFPETGISRGGNSNAGSGLFTFGQDDKRTGKTCGFNDSGSAARFFYCAKASKRDRDDGCDGLEQKYNKGSGTHGNGTATTRLGNAAERAAGITHVELQKVRNNHPTVKPTELMRYLVRLVTPPGGLVLDPFAGTGSTGRGAVLEGFCFLGCEIDASYAEIARLRIEAVTKEMRQPELFS